MISSGIGFFDQQNENNAPVAPVTGWDISTAVFKHYFKVNTEEANPCGFFLVRMEQKCMLLDTLVTM